MNKMISLSLSLLLIGATQFVSASEPSNASKLSIVERTDKLIRWEGPNVSITKSPSSLYRSNMAAQGLTSWDCIVIKSTGDIICSATCMNKQTISIEVAEGPGSNTWKLLLERYIKRHNIHTEEYKKD